MGSLKFNFKDKHVCITGGASGIGKHLSEKFLQAGADVTIWDLQAPKTSKASYTKVDVSSPESCDEAAQSLKKPLDFLVNNAGILKDRSLAKLSVEDYDKVISTNLNGVFYVTKSLLPYFQDTSFKRIVNLSSVVALYGNFGQTNYIAAKAGVIGMTKVWARELAKKSWTVNAIAPGFIETDILKNMPEDVLNKLIKQVPIGRLGQTEDIANACMFLCSEEASYINGTVLSVDGGVTV